MCSPVGHTLAAVAITLGRSKTHYPLGIREYLYVLVTGIFADFDFFIGWVYGDVNGYHHLGSHSLFAVIAYALVTYIVVRRFRALDYARWISATGGLIYLVHVVLDLLSTDISEPRGMQLFWPFSDQFLISPVTPFPRFLHETTGADMIGMVVGLFNYHNLTTILFESLIFIPIVWLVFQIRYYKKSI